MKLADKLKLIAAAAVVVAGIVAYYELADAHALLRTGAMLGSVIVALVIALSSEPGQSAWAFLRATSREVKKVVWPTNRETAQSTLAVVVIVLIVGVYIAMVDGVLKQILKALT